MFSFTKCIPIKYKKLTKQELYSIKILGWDLFGLLFKKTERRGKKRIIINIHILGISIKCKVEKSYSHILTWGKKS